MELLGKQLTLSSVELDQAENLTPAYNGNLQFLRWSGYENGCMALKQIQDDIQGTLDLPQGTVWRIADHAGALIGVAETAHVPTPDIGWIALLLIRQDFQGRGYGNEAATLLEQYLLSQTAIRQIGLAVLLPNQSGQIFWEQRGYIRTDQVKDRDGHEVYLYYRKRDI